MEQKEEVYLSMSDEEKIDSLKYEWNYYYKKILIMNLESDELKLNNIEQLEDYHKIELIETLKSDEYKLDYIQQHKEIDGLYKSRIILTFNSDDLKVQALNLFGENETYYKKDIIKTIKSDDIKIEAMQSNLKNYEFPDVLQTLHSSEKKIQSLDLLDSYSKTRFLYNIKLDSDEQRIGLIEKLNLSREIDTDVLINDVARQIEDINIRIKALSYLNSPGYKKDIILQLPEELRLNVLNETEISNIQVIDEIIESVDDNIKDSNLTSIKDEHIKARVLRKMQDDSLKLKHLDQADFINEEDIAMVVASLSNDELKLNELQRLTNEEKITLVIATLKSDEKKLDQMKNIEKDENIAFIGMSLSDREKQKSEFLKNNRKYTKIGLDEKITIGMEIESEGAKSNDILRLKKILETKQGIIWESKGDGSLEDGVEIVSPILSDNKDDVEDIYMICQMLQRCGQGVTENCGGHIHIGSDYLTSKEAYVNLFEIWGNCEEIIYKMANEKGQIPREGIQEYSTPISSKLNDAIENGTINLESEEDLDKFIEVIQEVQDNRYSGLNLLNINNGKNTIEFRIPNGSTNPDTWIENARLFGRIVQISQKITEVDKSTELGIEEQKLLQLRDRIKDENVPEQEKMETMLELLFSEEERKVYRGRYVTNTQILEQTSEDKNPFNETKFKKVDFKKKHTKDEMKEVAINERLENVNEVTYETSNGVRTENQVENANDRNMEE